MFSYTYVPNYGSIKVQKLQFTNTAPWLLTSSYSWFDMKVAWHSWSVKLKLSYHLPHACNFFSCFIDTCICTLTGSFWNRSTCTICTSICTILFKNIYKMILKVGQEIVIRATSYSNKCVHLATSVDNWKSEPYWF